MKPETTVAQLVGSALGRRSLHPAFALFARMVACELSRRTGRYLGAADASLASVKRIWRSSEATKTAPIRVLAPLTAHTLIEMPTTGGETAPIDEDIAFEEPSLSLKDP